MLLKKIARKILKSEIEKMQEEIKDLRKSGIDEMTQIANSMQENVKLTDQYKNTIDELNDQIKDLKYQNDILRQYYHLDEEPSEEIQAKMHIDMRCHNLERELDRQRNIADMVKVTLPLLNYNYGLINNRFANMLTMTKYGGGFW